MAAIGCAISPESALEQVLTDDQSDDLGDDQGDVTDDADDEQAPDEQADDGDEDDEDDGDLDSTKDAVRVNEPDASAPRDAGTTPAKDAGQDKPDAAAAADAATSTPVKDAAVDAGTAVATCTAGTYAGMFSVDISGGLSRDTFEGTVTLQLTGTGDNLKVQTGSLNGKDAAGNPLTAKVSGSLNCLTKKLEGGTVSDGVFEQRGLISTVRFSGTMAASFATETSALQGTWTLESSLKTRSGSGRFTAIRKP
jgi:hypothetical protein